MARQRTPPDWKAVIRAKLEALPLAPEDEEQIVEELALHLQTDYERLLEGGEHPDDARAAVLSRFADWRVLESELGRLRRLRRGADPDPAGGGDLLAELRFAVRRMLRQPLLSAALLLTLALGIGANATVFSTVRATLFAPLDHPDPDRLVYVWATNLERGFQRFSVNPIDFEDWRSRTSSFSGLALYDMERGNMLGPEKPESLRYAKVTPSFFEVLGASPLLGRLPTPEENSDGRGAVAVISHGLWQRHFGGLQDALGRTMSLDGQTLEVIGVMGPDFDFLEFGLDLWKPFGNAPTYDTTRGGYFARVVGRLKDGVSVEQAQREMDTVTAALAEEYPTNQGMGAFVEPLKALYTRPIRPAMLLLWGAVALMLVVVCVNVANLMLVQLERRGREISIRASLGATRGRILRQMLAEGLVTAVAGGLLGLLAANWGTQLLGGLAADSIPRAERNQLDWIVILYAGGLSVAVGLVSAFAPALAAARTNLTDGLRDRRASAGPGWRRLRSGLVVAQIALAAMVLSAAGLLVRSFQQVLAQNPGFEVEQLLTFSIEPPRRVRFTGDSEAFQRERNAERTEMGRRYQDFMDRIVSLPGASGVVAVNLRPLQGGGMLQLMDFVDRPEVPTERLPAVQQRVVTTGYFELMGIPLIEGRRLTAEDRHGGLRVCVVSEALARRHWPDESPLGARVTTEGRDFPETYLTVVGVVGDVRESTLEGEPGENLYVGFDQARKGFLNNWRMDFLVRTGGDPMALLPAVRRQLLELEPEWAIFSETTIRQELERTLRQRRFVMTLLLAFSAAVVLLAAVGLNAVLAHSVAQRRHDIGIRLAVGANRAQILRQFLREGVILGVVGVGLGLAAAVALSRLFESMLFQVEPQDPWTLSLVGVALLVTALAASSAPALRASRVDPVRSIRAD